MKKLELNIDKLEELLGEFKSLIPKEVITTDISKLKTDKQRLQFLYENRDTWVLTMDNDSCWLELKVEEPYDENNADYEPPYIPLDNWGRDLMILICKMFGIKADYC